MNHKTDSAACTVGETLGFSAIATNAKPLSVLVLCDYRTDIAETVRDHIDAFAKYSHHSIYVLSMFGDLPERLKLRRFDAIVVHYSLVLCVDAYVSVRAREALRTFDGIKVVFLQDEYRHVNRTINALREIDTTILFTCVPKSEVAKVYSEQRLPATKVESCLTGYVPTRLIGIDVPAYKDRRIDVGYRARRVPVWLGELGQEKVRIGEKFQRDAEDFGLVCNISVSEEDRLYGDKWTQFMMNCKAMLGVESGASVFDFDGTIRDRVDSHLLHKPATTYDNLKRLYFAGEEGKVKLNQISPRCFEAACLRTLMILYPGEYSGLLMPWLHYVPLMKNHSNMEEVVRVLRSPSEANRIIEQAYRDVALNKNLSYEHFVDRFDVVLSEAYRQLSRPQSGGYSVIEFSEVCRPNIMTRLRRLRRNVIDELYRVIFGVILRSVPVHRRDLVKRRLRWVWHLAKRSIGRTSSQP